MPSYWRDLWGWRQISGTGMYTGSSACIYQSNIIRRDRMGLEHLRGVKSFNKGYGVTWLICTRYSRHSAPLLSWWYGPWKLNDLSLLYDTFIPNKLLFQGTKSVAQHQGPRLLTFVLPTLTPAWMSNYSHYKMWDKITYPFPNFHCATIEWISNFISHSTGHVSTY